MTTGHEGGGIVGLEVLYLAIGAFREQQKRFKRPSVAGSKGRSRGTWKVRNALRPFAITYPKSFGVDPCRALECPGLNVQCRLGKCRNSRTPVFGRVGLLRLAMGRMLREKGSLGGKEQTMKRKRHGAEAK
ncbi:hypothetical protein MHYP_G00192620 [Metynnis hypsauchen]